MTVVVRERHVGLPASVASPPCTNRVMVEICSQRADVLGISEHIARKHYAKWSPARQQRISSIMSLVQSGGAAAQPPARQEKPAVIQ